MKTTNTMSTETENATEVAVENADESVENIVESSAKGIAAADINPADFQLHKEALVRLQNAGGEQGTEKATTDNTGN